MALSQIRGSSKAPFWVTEAQIGRTAGPQRHLLQPGIVRLWSHQEIAHGAEGIVFFPFRTFPYAHEHMMNGLVEIDSRKRRKMDEIRQTSEEILQIKALIGAALPTAKAAILRDYRCDWAFEDGRFSSDFRYMRHLFGYYKALREHSVTTDIISPGDTFDGYQLLIVPAQVLTSAHFCHRLKQAAQQGTTLLITCMTGLRESNMESPGRLVREEIEELAGITILEQHALIGEKSASFSFTAPPDLIRPPFGSISYSPGAPVH